MFAGTRSGRRNAGWQRSARTVRSKFVNVVLHAFHTVLRCLVVLLPPMVPLSGEVAFTGTFAEEVWTLIRPPHKAWYATQLGVISEGRPCLLDLVFCGLLGCCIRVALVRNLAMVRFYCFWRQRALLDHAHDLLQCLVLVCALHIELEMQM